MDIKLTAGSAQHLGALQEAVRAANQRFLEAASVLALQAEAQGDFVGAGLEQRPDGVYLVLTPAPAAAPTPNGTGAHPNRQIRRAMARAAKKTTGGSHGGEISEERGSPAER
jgi:hypothetical protein